MTSGEAPKKNDEETLETALAHSVAEGVRRLHRGWPELLSTGLVGGIDISVGILAMLIVQHLTGDPIAASLAFSVGFIALLLARSELFTENFLVPLAAVAAHREPVSAVFRLWVGTGLMNLLGGWLMAGLIVAGFPHLGELAAERGAHFVELGVGWRSLAVAMLAGAIITLMTWMIEGTSSVLARIVASVAAGFLLAAGQMNHCVVASLEMFGGLWAGAPYDYLDWLRVFGWAALGNMVGGIGLVTVLRLIQAIPWESEAANPLA